MYNCFWPVDEITAGSVAGLTGDASSIEAVSLLTHTQRDLYLDCLRNPEGKGHQVVLYGIIQREINLDLWRENLHQYVQENPVLRSELIAGEDAIYQVVWKMIMPVFTFIDHSADLLSEVDIRQLVENMKFPNQDLRHPLIHHFLLKIHERCYVTMFRIHHVLIDGSCGKLYIEQIANRYFALLRQEELPRKVDWSFFEYTSFHHRLFDKPEITSWWKEQLSTVAPLDQHYGISREEQLVREVWALTDESYKEIEVYCKNNQIKENYFWFAVFALTARYQLGIDHPFCIRTFSGGRKVRYGQDTYEYEQALGCFYHIIPVLFNDGLWGKTTSVSELATAINKQVSGLGEKRFVSMKTQNTFIGKETCTLYYNYQPFWDIDIDGDQSYFEERYNDMKDQVEFRVAFTHGRLELHLDFNPKYFNGYYFLERAGMIAQQVIQEAAVISHLDYLLPVEKAMHKRVNAGPAAVAPATSFPDLFLEAASLFAPASALGFNHTSISYKELDQSSAQIATYLLNETNLQQEGIVALLLPRSAQFVQFILGTWKAGGAYLPLSPDLPADRLNTILAVAKPHLIITEETMPAFDTGGIRLITASTMLEGSKHLAPYDYKAGTVKGNQLAYIIFTSGSTGQPKGVCIEHSGMINHLQAKQDLLMLTRSDIVAQNAASSFDISIWQMFNALLYGGQTIVYDKDIVLNIQTFLRKIQEDGVTILELIPGYLRMLLSECKERDQLSHLRYLLVTGEELHQELVNEWYTHFPAIPLVNAYGPTEASDDITHHIAGTQPSLSGLVPIGTPVRNTNIYILNTKGHSCGMYIKGELFVSGAGVGRGYLDDPERNRQAFSADPYYPSWRMYRTGDTARWRPDGQIEFLGRNDQQIKLHGYRIEIPEIELTAKTHPAVQQVAVLPIRQEGATPFLCCYYTAAEDLEQELRTYLKQKLPHYMVPAAFKKIDRFPYTPNGKTDRQALTKLSVETKTTATDPILEEVRHDQLYQHWSNVLNVQNMAWPAHFFENGGDSIKAMKLINRIRKEMGIELNVAEVFRNPTYAAFREIVDKVLYGKAGQHTNIIPSLPEAPFYQLSYGQQRLCVTEQISDTAAAYIMVAAFRLKGNCNQTVMEQAIGELVRRHQILSSYFTESRGSLSQQFTTDMHVNMVVTDISGNPDVQSVLEEIITNESNTPFNLSVPPLFRTRLVKTGEQEHVLIYAVHHLLTDGWSKSVILRDIILLYNQGLTGLPQALPALSIQYRDFSHWQRQQVETQQWEQQRLYWRRNLQKITQPTLLPFDFARPAQKIYEGETLLFFCGKDKSEQLQHWSAQQGCTLFQVTVAAVNLLLYKYNGAATQLIGTSVSGRTQKELEELVGFFINTIPLINAVYEEQTVIDFVKNVRNNILRDFEQQDYPFLLMLEEMEENGHTSPQYLVNIYVEFHNYQATDAGAETKTAFHDLELEVVREHHVKALFDLEFNFEMMNNELALRLIYNTSLYRNSTARLIGMQIMELLGAMPTNNSSLIKDFIATHAEVLHTGVAAVADDSFDFNF